MSLVWADSFDHYGSGETGLDNMRAGSYGAVIESVDLSTTFVRTGTYSLRLRQSVSVRTHVRRVIPGGGRDTVGLGYGLYMPSLPSTSSNELNNPHGVFFRSASGILLAFAYRSDGSIQIFKGGISETIGSTDAGVLDAGAFQHVEIAAHISPIAGWIEIRVDGVRVYRIEDIDTGNTLVTNVEWGASGTSNFSFEAYIDDIVCWDESGTTNNTFIGPCRIVTVFATADDAVDGFTVVGADTATEATTEVPPDRDDSYIQADEVGAEATFTLPELPAEIVAVPGIYVQNMSRLEDAGVGRLQFSLITATDGEEVSTEIPLTPAYSYTGSVFELNPDTGNNWTKEEFETALLRIKKTM